MLCNFSTLLLSFLFINFCCCSYNSIHTLHCSICTMLGTKICVCTMLTSPVREGLVLSFPCMLAFPPILSVRQTKLVNVTNQSSLGQSSSVICPAQSPTSKRPPFVNTKRVVVHYAVCRAKSERLLLFLLCSYQRRVVLRVHCAISAL